MHRVRGPVAWTRPVSAEHKARAETRAEVEKENMISRTVCLRGKAFLGHRLYTRKNQAISIRVQAAYKKEVTVRVLTEVVGAELHSRPKVARVMPWRG